MKLLSRLLFVLLFSCISVDGIAVNKSDPFENLHIPNQIAECVASINPGVTQVQKRALKYSRMAPKDLSDWKRKIKKAAFLPRLQIGYQRKVVDGVSVDVDDSVSVTSSGVNVGPTSSGWQQDLDRNNNIEITAVWYLDELIFNRDELSISSEVRSQISSRRALLSEVTEIYFELKKALSIYYMARGAGRGSAGQLRLKIDYLIGSLDALTGGWFAEAFKWKGRRCE